MSKLCSRAELLSSLQQFVAPLFFSIYSLNLPHLAWIPRAFGFDGFNCPSLHRIVDSACLHVSDRGGNCVQQLYTIAFSPLVTDGLCAVDRSFWLYITDVVVQILAFHKTAKEGLNTRMEDFFPRELPCDKSWPGHAPTGTLTIPEL